MRILCSFISAVYCFSINYAFADDTGTTSSTKTTNTKTATDLDTVETKHIKIPFLTDVTVKKHRNGTKDVDVKAPLVKVHNPAGPNNAQVKAPFYKEEHTIEQSTKTTNN